jgi:Icc-related predicted phosphoesterase
MKIVLISDSHGQHHLLDLPPGDVLVHAGDFSRSGKPAEAKDFLRWLADQPFRHKIFVAGNHDFIAEKEPALFRSWVPDNCTYLEDQQVEVEGLRIWGSPITPWFFDWAFNRNRGGDICRHWDFIPDGLDLLITHGPPAGILDVTARGEHVGCEDLRKRIEKARPKVSVFGHIHEAYGRAEVDGTSFYNASVLDLGYRMANPPFVIEI